MAASGGSVLGEWTRSDAWRCCHDGRWLGDGKFELDYRYEVKQRSMIVLGSLRGVWDSVGSLRGLGV